MSELSYTINPIGIIRSSLTHRDDAPKQGYEGAPEAWLDIASHAAQGLEGLRVGDAVIVLTWFHQAERDTLQVHPRDDVRNPLMGVFATRSSDRPNPIGLHRVTILEIAENRLRVEPLEAIDGTPIVDIKPVLSRSADS